MSEIHYIYKPNRYKTTSRHVKAYSIYELLDNESYCRDVLKLINENYRHLHKFLTVLRHATYIYMMKEEETERVLAFLLVTENLNWQIDYVTVCQERRKKGVAQAMLNTCLNQAYINNIPYVMLSSKEELIPLYESVGFKQI